MLYIYGNEYSSFQNPILSIKHPHKPFSPPDAIIES